MDSRDERESLALHWTKISPLQGSGTVQRTRDRRPRTNIGNVTTLNDDDAAFNPHERIIGLTIVRVRPSATRTHRCTISTKRQ
jgi:hypothetical protein